MRSAMVTYEVTGASAESILIETNRTLDEAHACMQNVRVAGEAGHVRVMFAIDGSHEDHQRINLLLHQSTVFSTVASLGSVNTSDPGPMEIAFTKASACGNDFLIVDGTLVPNRARRVNLAHLRSPQWGGGGWRGVAVPRQGCGR